jgi:glycosyltransferase involved in cell wall biosynthesis
MRIAQLATNVECVPPVGYGGTELVVHLLTEELVRRGHQVTLFATGNSSTKARLVSTVDLPLRTHPKILPTQWNAYDIRSCLTLMEMQDEFDIVHNHMGYQALPFTSALRPATVTTLHNAIKPYCEDIYFKYGYLPFVAISESYRRSNFPDKVNFAATIYNGIDSENFCSAAGTQRDYLLFLGRLCRDKGTAEAIDIARTLNLPIKLAGKVDRNDQGYFDQEVKPRLAAYEKAVFIGEVDHDEKKALYANAKAVVYPLNFDEPFGLVMVESLASGTPVMAVSRGSVSEILEDGKTAIVGSSVQELIERYSELERISPEDCRNIVRDRFSVKQMVDGYEQLYDQLLLQNKEKTSKHTSQVDGRVFVPSCS